MTTEPFGLPLPVRRLGRVPVYLTELSFGGAAIENMFTEVSDDAARAAVDAAWDGCDAVLPAVWRL
jgi:D-threo-aldose 1-dehydrogenase